MKYLAIIPARSGSKGVPNKNIRDINGHPLISWSIKQALKVPAISNVMVSTDSVEIANIAKKYGAEVPFIRPLELALDETATEPVMKHAIDWYESNNAIHDAVILLQPTSPLRFKRSIESAIELFEKDKASALLSVCESHSFFWKDTIPPTSTYDFKHRPRRQDIKNTDITFRETGSIYITLMKVFKHYENRLAENITLFKMDPSEGFDIDSQTDFIVIESLMKVLSHKL